MRDWRSLLLPRHARNVLVCLRYGIGDVLMELPVLAGLRRALPTAHITALANAPSHELLAGDERVDSVLCASRWGLSHRWDPGTAGTRAAIADWVRRSKFDLVLNAGQAADAVSAAIWSLGIRSLESREPVERQVIRSGGTGREAIREAVRQGWGLEVPPGAELRIRRRDHERAEHLLRELGTRHPIALSPVASLGLKRWPTDRLARVADVVLETGPVLVLEGPDEAGGREVVDAMSRREGVLRLGAEHLLVTAALLTRCRALVCNDTGLMHLAAAVGTPTVAIFGPTQPRVFLPEADHVVACAPSTPCPHRTVHSLSPPACWQQDRCLVGEDSCVRDVGPEQVLSALASLGVPTGAALT